MHQPDWDGPLDAAHRAATNFLHGLPTRQVGATASRQELMTALGGELPEDGVDAVEVVQALAKAAEPGLVATQSGRFFGFVIGGASPASMAADWLASSWDQNAGLSLLTPSAAAIEEIAGAWMIDLFGLPAQTSVGFVTGAQMANFTALAAARHHVLMHAGWDVERTGLFRAPHIRVLAGRDHHDTIDRAPAVPRPRHGLPGTDRLGPDRADAGRRS